MKQTDLIKEDGKWFIILPEYIEQGGVKQDLELDDDIKILLEKIAKGSSEVSFLASETPFEGADCLVLDEPATASVGGAYYIIKILEGKPLNQRIWLKDLLLLVFEEIPEFIYFKTVLKPGK